MGGMVESVDVRSVPLDVLFRGPSKTHTAPLHLMDYLQIILHLMTYRRFKLNAKET